MTSTPGKKAMLPVDLVQHIQSFKQHSEYPCQYNVLLTYGAYGNHYEFGETRIYRADIELILHPNLQSEYRQWVYRRFRRIITNYYRQHRENIGNPDRFFISDRTSAVDGEYDLEFTYLNDHFGWDDGYDQKLYDLKGEMDEF